MARNRGLKEATGDIILFIGDDIFLEPGFLMQHMNIHTLNPDENVVVLGYTTWDPFLTITPYMRFLESSGWQFAYHLLEEGFVKHPEPYKFFYTSNISLKKSLFEKEKFSSQFTDYGWEDIELAYRLWSKHEMRLYYEPKAVAFHHHMMSEKDLEKRMETVGRSAIVFESLHPKLQVIPRGWKAYLLRMITHSFFLFFLKKVNKNIYFKFKSWQAFLLGAKSSKI